MKPAAIEELRQKMIHTKGVKKDFDGYYGKMVFNNKGNAGIIIRAVAIDEVPIVQRYNHAFDYNKFIVDCCATSIGEPCCICEHVQRLRASGDIATAKDRQAKVKHVTNVVIISDPIRPANEGRVMLINLAQTAAHILMDAEGFDPWDVLTGKNFELRAVKAGQSWPDYSTSRFVKEPSVLGTPEEIAAILAQCIPLASVLKPSFTYEELAERYARKYGVITKTATPKDDEDWTPQKETK